MWNLAGFHQPKFCKQTLLWNLLLCVFIFLFFIIIFNQVKESCETWENVPPSEWCFRPKNNALGFQARRNFSPEHNFRIMFCAGSYLNKNNSLDNVCFETNAWRSIPSLHNKLGKFQTFFIFCIDIYKLFMITKYSN